MPPELVKYIMVYLISTVKFIGGPGLGAAYDLPLAGTAIMTILGMMTSVTVITFFGIQLRAWLISKIKVKRKVFTKRNRRIVKLWRAYGEFGVAFLTPVFFSPIVGTLLITMLGGKRKKVFIYMLICAVFWAFTLTALSEVLLDFFLKA